MPGRKTAVYSSEKMNTIINADALQALKTIESESIDTCVTSPPYYQLRDYGVNGQIGLESTPEEYIDKMVAIFAEVKRVLKPDGTLWLNIADTYAGSHKGRNVNGSYNNKIPHDFKTKGRCDGNIDICRSESLKRKNLMLIPYRLALALQADGWIIRQDIIWNKPNCMPESANDRCTKSHEYIFLLAKQPNYYFNCKAIMEPCVGNNNQLPAGSKGTLGQPNSRARAKGNNKTFKGGGVYTNNRAFDNSADNSKSSIGNKPNKSGLKRKRSVWNIATKGYKGSHFATFPTELAKNCILAGSREGSIVLDPFAGSGTVGEVAKEYKRNYILIEINADYCKLIDKRLNCDDM